jgi:hypothetical protein
MEHSGDNWLSLFGAHLQNIKWRTLESTNTHRDWANQTIIELDKAVTTKFFEPTYDEWISYFNDRSEPKPCAFMRKILLWKELRTEINDTTDIREMRFIQEVYLNNSNTLPN